MRENGAELRLVRRACSRLHLDQIPPQGLARPIAQGLFDAGHVFAELSQNPFELFAAWHLGAKLLKDERIGRFANSPGCCVGGLGFQPAQAPAIDKRLWILAYWRTTKL